MKLTVNKFFLKNDPVGRSPLPDQIPEDSEGFGLAELEPLT
jgi:hypothetical protein